MTSTLAYRRIGLRRLSARILSAITLSVIALIGVSDMEAADRTAIYSPSFRSLQVYPEGNYYAPPIVSLGAPSDRITVSFDEIADSRSYLRYRLVHCDAMWRPDGLLESEYLTGFNEAEIETYDFSQGTNINYVHYSLTVPNEQMNYTLSGNYLLQVYNEDDPDTTLLQAAFSVTENNINLGAGVTSRTDFDYNGRHQQLDIEADYKKAPALHNPYTDLAIIVSQNGRIDNEVILRSPSRAGGGKASYQHLPELVFPAGNEYRRMECVSTLYPGMNVETIEYAEPFYHIIVRGDESREGQSYLYDQTQFGRFTVRNANTNDSDTEADYVMAHFTLYAPQLKNADVFLDGDFTQRRFDPESLMVYNPAYQAYEKTMMLKQGAYNYQYLTVPHGSMKGATSPMEGDYYQTVNEYLIKAYYRVPGERYDRLGGVTVVYSGM